MDVVIFKVVNDVRLVVVIDVIIKVNIVEMNVKNYVDGKIW